MSKSGKVYLWVCLALLVICVLLFKPLDFYVSDHWGEPLSFYAGLFFALLMAIHFNIFWGVQGGVERFWGTLLVVSFTYMIVGGLFEVMEWVVVHVRIV